MLVVSVKWHSYKCQHPMVPSRKYDFNEMISVIPFTCGFIVVAD